MQHQPKPTILLVDDDHDDLQMLHEAFKAFGPKYSILDAHDGKQAINKLHELKAVNQLPCLIVLDVNMPYMDGKETLVAIRNHDEFKSIPVIVFSTSSSLVDKHFFSHHGVEMLTKPWQINLVPEAVSQMLFYCAV